MSAADDLRAKAGERVKEAMRGKKQARPSLRDSGKCIISAGEFITSFEPPELVIPALQLRKRAVYSMTGKTGHGKTAIEYRLAVCVAAGWDFAGKTVPQGRVLILAGENPEDHLMRLILAQHRYPALSDEVINRIMVLPHSFPLHDHADEVVAMAAELGKFDMTFVDTAAAYFHGEDDSANMPMRDLAMACRVLIYIPGGPCVVVPAHPNRAADSPEAMVPRGGGAFLNEMDGNLSVWSAEMGVSTTLHWTGKWRGPSFEPVTLRLDSDTAPKLITRAGDPITSVLAEPITEAEAEKIEAQQVEDHLALLEKMLAVHPSTPSLSGFAERLGWPKSKVRRAMYRLAGMKPKLVDKNLQDHWQLTDRGRKEATKLMERGASL
jgi:hypothetical protein